jgi:hypothetical protein
VSTTAIVAEGVLRRVVSGTKIQQGVDLYYGLATRTKIVLVTDELEKTGELQYWLKVEGLHEHVSVIWSDIVLSRMSTPLARERQLNGYSQGVIDLVVEPDPNVSAHLVTAGYSTLTFTHAAYSLPEWRPDFEFEVVPWDSLAKQVANEAYLRATDTRKDDDDKRAA